MAVTTISPAPAFICGNSLGKLFVVSADCTSAISISQADFNTFAYNNYPTYELSDALINSLPVRGGTVSP